jgi:C-terminal processing protease CtpA/Prc
VPFSPAERVAELALVRDVMRETYSHLELKRRQWGVDLDQLYARYAPLVEAADTWDRLERVMAAFAGEFHDAHVAWRRRRGRSETPRRVVRLGLATRFVGEDLIVSEVWPASGAERAGLRRGDRVVGIDGQTVEERLGRLASVRSWSRREDARYDFADEWPAARAPVDGEPPPRRVTRELADGTYETLSVAPETRPRAGGRPPAVELVEGGEALRLVVRNLSGPLPALERLLDDALAKVPERPGLIVDLRGNPGGMDRAARLCASRLVRVRVVGASVRIRLSPRSRARSEWRDLIEDSAEPGWSVPQPVVVETAPSARPLQSLVVLVDAGCRSSCEALTLLLRGAGGRLVGERTGGSSGAPIVLHLPRSGANVTIPAWEMFDLRGRPIEGSGVEPDVEVAPTRADLAAGRDPVLERAAHLLTEKP